MPSKHIYQLEDEKHIKENLKSGRIAEVVLEKMIENYDAVIKDVISKGINGEISHEDIGTLLNSHKEIVKTAETIVNYNKNFEGITGQNSSNRLTDSEKEKIYHYSKTGDFSQDQLAKIFNTTQSTISRTLKSRDKQ